MKATTVRLAEVCEINPSTDFDFAPDDPCSFVRMEAVDDVDARIHRLATKSFRDVAKGYTQFAEDDVIIARIAEIMMPLRSLVSNNSSLEPVKQSKPVTVTESNTRKIRVI